jgi:hypothetical protein
MPTRSNPLDVVTAPLPDSVVDGLIKDALKADDDRLGWLEKQRQLSKIRYLVRPKNKTFPWPGCSNIGIPLIDTIIRKYKPMLMKLLVESDPVVEFQGEDPEAVDSERLAEDVYSWLFRTESNAIESMSYVIDIMAHRGLSFGQVNWQYRRERQVRSVSIADILPPGVVPDQIEDQGILQLLVQHYELQEDDLPEAERVIEEFRAGQERSFLRTWRVVHDRPVVWERDPVQVIVPPRTTDIADAEWIVVQHVLTLRQLKRMEADGYFRPGAVDEIMTHKDDDNVQNDPFFTPSQRMLEEMQREREKIWGHEDEGNMLVWEVFTWHDSDNDGKPERIHTWIHPRSKVNLISRPYLFPFARWPLVPFHFERTNRRWHSSRGISHMLEFLQREVNAQHNARIDGMTLRNAPAYQVTALGQFRGRNYRVIPGTVLTMPGAAKIEPILHDRGAFPETAQEENILRRLAEDYVGTFDAAVSDPFRGGGSPRTATEIQAVAQFASSTASFDAILFQTAMKELHTMLWSLFHDLGPREVFIRVGGTAAEPISRLVRKSDIDHKYRLVPVGTIANTNRALELAHAREALQLYVNDATGFINPWELRRWHLSLLDSRRARRILNDPNQAQELTTLRQAASELQNNPELQAALQGGVNQVPPEEAERHQTEFLPRRSSTEF